MKKINQSRNILFYLFLTSISLLCVYSISKFLWIRIIFFLRKQICISAFYFTVVQHGVPCREVGVTSDPQQEQEHLPAGLPLLFFIPFLSPSPTTSFWAAQSRMRVTLPMSPLRCRNPTFWQHSDLLTSQLHKADRIFLCFLQHFTAFVITAVNEIIKRHNFVSA